MTNNRLDEICRKIATANRLAKQLSRQLLGCKKYKAFREVLRGGQSDQLTTDQHALINGLPENQKHVMQDTDKLRDEIILGFSSLVWATAIEITRRCQQAEKDDLANQGMLHLIDVIYGYSDESITFYAYAKSSLRRELKRYTISNRTGGLTSNSSEYHDILHAQIMAQSRLLQAGLRCDFHSVLTIVQEILGDRAPDDLSSRLLGIFGAKESIHNEFDDKEFIIVSDNDSRTDDVIDIYNLMSSAGLDVNQQQLLIDYADGEELKTLAKKYRTPAREIKQEIDLCMRQLRHHIAKQKFKLAA